MAQFHVTSKTFLRNPKAQESRLKRRLKALGCRKQAIQPPEMILARMSSDVRRLNRASMQRRESHERHPSAESAANRR
jgi:hypothetical protein